MQLLLKALFHSVRGGWKEEKFQIVSQTAAISKPVAKQERKVSFLVAQSDGETG